MINIMERIHGSVVLLAVVNLRITASELKVVRWTKQDEETSQALG
jgi:hypothetical protein